MSPVVSLPPSISTGNGADPPARLRLLLADDDQRIRDYLCEFLRSDHDVVGEAADGLDVVRLIEELHPDILLLDISMPGLSGFKVAQELRRRGNGVKIILVSAHTERAYLDEAERIGIDGFVSKDRARSELSDAIRWVDRGIRYISPELLNR